MARGEARAAEKEALRAKQMGGVDSNTLHRHMEAIQALQNEAAEGSMAVASYAKTIESEGVNRDAFFLCKRLLRMERGKARAMATCFASYWEILGEDVMKDLFDKNEGVADSDADGDAKPYDQGVKAGKAALDRGSNPFDEGTPERQEWFDGWSAGQTSNIKGLGKKTRH